MQSSHQTFDRSRWCHICRAALLPGSTFCSSCGTRAVEMPAEELRGVIYLLSELTRWEAKGIVSPEQAATLRQRYEHRREILRARIESKDKQAETFTPSPIDAHAPALNAPPPVEASSQTHAQEAEATTAHAHAAGAETPDYSVATAFSQFLSKSPPSPARVPVSQRPHRTLIETLADPYTLRLLLYTGAAMLVVGIVIWLRDVLYLKLQEPVVQAALLAAGTLAVTASGWYTILRTRQRLTGRALTLVGSVLVPVNFWFLVRSGLIANNGRAWIVCAFCAMLYAHTAALLRERLYVYLACIAGIATSWALVFRSQPDAFGLYALTLMIASLVFLHLSRLFPLDRETRSEGSESSLDEEDGVDKSGVASQSRFSYELWGTPLVRVALTGATLCALLYMPLRLWPSALSFYDGIFRLRASTYDPSLAMLLFAAAAYVAWFTGRYIYTDRRFSLYTLSTLALFWTEFLALDGFRLTGSAHLLALAATTLAITSASRFVRVDDEASRAFHLAGALLSLLLAVASLGILLAASAYTVRQSAALACLGLSFALLSTPRFCERLAQAAFAHASAIFASLAFLVALNSASLQSETLFVAALAAWPFALYTGAIFAGRQLGEAQLTAPFVRVADAELVILFLWASVLALFLHVQLDSGLPPLRPSMFCALFAAVLYGVLRGVRERSTFGAVLASFAALTLVAASLDALRSAGLWPGSWPIAAGVICTAYLLGKAAPGLLERKSLQNGVNARSLDRVISFVMDSVVLACALLWFARAVYYIDEGGFSASFVLLLALLYWTERTALTRSGLIAHIANIHAGAFFIALLSALRIDTQWFAAAAAFILFPIFFAMSRRARDAGWLASPARVAASVTLALAFAFALLRAAPHLRAGDPLLLAPLVSLGAIALASFCASLLSEAATRVRYFRVGVSATVIAFALGCLRAGFDPVSDIEIYTSPVAVLLLAVAYLSARRAWEEYSLDTSLLLWMGSLLLSMPLLLHALYFRLLLDVPAPARDIGTLCAALALILFGVTGRLRAPVLVGLFTLTLELAALTLTSVDWLQVPLKYYLITVGALMLLVFWMFEYRSEQILLARRRFNDRRAYARERFGEWR